MLSDYADIAGLEAASRAPGAPADVWNALGQARLQAEDLPGAKAAFEEALTRGLSAGDRPAQAIARGHLGVVAELSGDWAQAEAQFRRSLKISDAEGRKAGQATCHMKLGELAMRRRNAAAAARHFETAHSLYTDLKDQEGVTAAVGNLGLTAKQTGAFDVAETALKRSFALAEKNGRHDAMAIAVNALAHLALERGAPDQAKTYFNSAIKIDRALGQTAGVISNLMALAEIAHDEGEDARAKALWLEAGELVGAVSDKPLRERVLRRLHAVGMGPAGAA